MLQHICKGLAAIVACLMPFGVSAQDGRSAYNFLNIPLSSKLYGLGGVNISLVDDDVAVIDQNPALLGQEMSGQITMGYMRYVGESNFAGARYAHSLGEHGAWSAAIQYFGYGSQTHTDQMGNVLGTFSANDAIFMGAYSHDITDRIRGGINLKLAYSSYAEYSAMAIATDLGVNYYNPETDLSLSAVVANLGGQVKKFNEHYDRLPIDVRLGWSQSFGTFPVRFSVTAWNLTKWKLPYYEYGDGTSNKPAEIKESFTSNFFRHLVFAADLIASQNWTIGLGYNYKTRTDMLSYSRSILSGFSLEAGLRVSNFGVGVAMSQPSSGATTFMLNLSYTLSSLL